MAEIGDLVRLARQATGSIVGVPKLPINTDADVDYAARALVRFFADDPGRNKVALSVRGTDVGCIDRSSWTAFAIGSGILGIGMAVAYTVRGFGGSDQFILPGDVDLGAGYFSLVHGDSDFGIWDTMLALVSCPKDVVPRMMSAYDDAHPARCPVHPGEFLRRVRRP